MTTHYAAITGGRKLKDTKTGQSSMFKLNKNLVTGLNIIREG
jgi:hypothetical protein